MKKKYYFLTAIISYLIFLVASIPAKPVTDLINENTALSLNGVSGNVWNGKAFIIDIDNTVSLHNTRWSFSLWKLLIGQLAIDLSTQYLDNDINTEIGASVTGWFFVNDLNAEISASALGELVNIPLAQLDGLISLNIENAQWKQGELPVASGQINWSDASVTIADTASLGNVSITLYESEQELLVADINNQGGDIKLNGKVELVPEENYSIDLKLTPMATASNSIKQSLGMFAKKQRNGEYLLKSTGSLSQTGLI
jgi:hypothetical protein